MGHGLGVLQGLSRFKLPRWWHDEVIRAFKLGGLDVHSRAQHVEYGSSRSAPVDFRAGGAENHIAHSRRMHK